jgi:hypothetical protein
MSIQWTKEMLDTVRRGRSEGLSLRECAKQVGVSHRTMQSKCAELRLGGEFIYKNIVLDEEQFHDLISGRTVKIGKARSRVRLTLNMDWESMIESIRYAIWEAAQDTNAAHYPRSHASHR